MRKRYCIGLDYGTDSVRAVLIDIANGETLATHIHGYQRWKEGKYCDAQINQFRQHPLDHIEGLEQTVRGVMDQSGINPSDVKAIGVDTTGSSPIPVDELGMPLALNPDFSKNPNAMMVLWKDHTAIREADEINDLARTWGGQDFTKYSGGIYSSEWFWSKILHIVRKDEKVRAAAYAWMEHCDLMTYLLTGATNISELKASRCAAGHKAMWHSSWGGLPDEKFLTQLDPYLGQLKQRLYTKTYTSDQSAGTLSAEWATKLNLTTDVVVAVGTLDAHAGAVGAGAKTGQLVKVMGTSTCDMIVSSYESIGQHTVSGICGQVDGSIVPGMIGLEAGQSAFGDVLAWFRELVSWPIDHLSMSHGKLSDEEVKAMKDELRGKMLVELSDQAAKLPITKRMPVALDWVNGRRTPDADQTLKAAIMSLSLGTKTPHLFRALVEGICFGSKKIVERFISEGVKIEAVVGIGGVAKKSSFVMQTLANILNLPIKIVASEQTAGAGAVMYAAAAAGIYDSLSSAQECMVEGYERVYEPNVDDVPKYESLYQDYLSLGEFVEETNNKQLNSGQ